MKERKKECFLFPVQVVSMLLLNFSSHSSRDIFPTPLNGHFSSPHGSNLRGRILMKQLYVSKNHFISLRFVTCTLGFMWKGILHNEEKPI